MEERDILEKLKNENETYVPDLRNKIVSRAKAEGLLQFEEAQVETERNGNTVALKKSKIKVAAIAACALVAAASLITGVAIGLNKNPGTEGPGGGFLPPTIEKPGDGYSVGAVATAKLMDEYFGEEQAESQPVPAKHRAVAARSESSGIENFGVYFSAFDSFFMDGMLDTVYNPLENNDFESEALIYGKYANGTAAEFRMAYNEIYDIAASTETEVHLYLDGYISLGYNHGYPLSGKRTVAIVDGEEVQTALEIYAYRSYTDKTSYAKMELTDAGFKFTVVLNGETESEAVMYRPADKDSVAYEVEISGEEGGTFTVGMPSEDRDEVTIDYVKGDTNGQYYTKSSHKDMGFILCDYLVYQPSADGSYWSVSGCIEDKAPQDGALVIPTYVGGKPVKKISSSAFANKNYITSVVMPDTVDSIGSQAFYNCKNLVEVVLSSAVNDIDYFVFGNCSKLESINLHDGIETITFYAFYDCSALVNFDLPANLRYVGRYAFYGCKGNTELKLGAKFKELGEAAFAGWDDLQTITVDPANTIFKSVNNCLINTQNNTLYAGTANSVIPADGSVKTIAEYSFYKCNVNSIDIPSSVDVIKDYAFCACRNLTQITIPDKKIEMGKKAFYISGYYDNEANWDGNLLYIGKHLISGKPSTADDNETVTLKKGTLTVAQEAFDGCNFKSIVFNSELLYIGKGVASNSNFSYLSFDGENALYAVKDNCLIDIAEHKLIAAGKAAVIPEDGSVTSIGYGAFVRNYRSNFDSDNKGFVIPACIVEIESYAFYNSNFDKLIFQSDYPFAQNTFFNCYIDELVFINGAPNGYQVFVFCNIGSITCGKGVYLPDIMTFDNCQLHHINFDGTMEEWRELTKGEPWYDAVSDIIIVCKDGKLDKWGHEITE